MAKFDISLPNELIKEFERLSVNTEKMLSDMVEEGARVSKNIVMAKMPSGLRESIDENNVILTKVYKTPSDDGINCQVMIVGYFKNRYGETVPAPLVANMFEYGSTKRKYPKQPFFRQSFNKSEIESAMLKIQEKYIKGG